MSTLATKGPRKPRTISVGVSDTIKACGVHVVMVPGPAAPTWGLVTVALQLRCAGKNANDSEQGRYSNNMELSAMPSILCHHKAGWWNIGWVTGSCSDIAHVPEHAARNIKQFGCL